MRTTQYLLSTLKEIPATAEIISHQLMLRAGIIRKLSSGLYTWLPTGVKILKKIENIVREEMHDIGALEIAMPVIQPAKLWQESGRSQQYGKELFNITDRHGRLFILGPTHEEVVTSLIRDELNTYKKLPITVYQIQSKFRDELRPRFGVMRSREFIMKDAYSFHISRKCLQHTYNAMYLAYNKIFTRMHLDFRIVQADTGSIGGNISHEFQVLTNNGEDRIFLSNISNYAANIDSAEAVSPSYERSSPTQPMSLFDTPCVKNITDLVKYHDIPLEKTIKTLLVKGNQSIKHKLIALLVRGDHQLNLVKVGKLDIVDSPVTMANELEIRSVLGANPGSLGPVGLSIPVIADRTVVKMSDFCAGANINGKHFKNINWGRDLPEPRTEDIRNVVVGDPSPDGKGVLQIKYGIEVGHIFQLGTKYSSIIKSYVRDQNGNNKIINMGCYGIGITRLLSAVIEQNHDQRGIIWPLSIAPFEVAILPINMNKSCYVKKIAETLYQTLLTHGIDVIIDDREESLGVMFSDIELIGIPHIISISHRTLSEKKIEYQSRMDSKKYFINQENIVDFLMKKLNKDK